MNQVLTLKTHKESSRTKLKGKYDITGKKQP